jgi:hypothetical protein
MRQSAHLFDITEVRDPFYRTPARLMRRHQRELAVRGVCHTHYPRFFGPNVKTRFSSSLFHVAEAT